MDDKKTNTFSVALKFTRDSLDIGDSCNKRKAEKYSKNRMPDFYYKRKLVKKQNSPLGDVCTRMDILLKLEWELFYCVWFEICKSRRFKKSFICWVLDKIESYSMNGIYDHSNKSQFGVGRHDGGILVKFIHPHRLVQLVLKRNEVIEARRQAKHETIVDVCILMPVNVLNINKEIMWYVIRSI